MDQPGLVRDGEGVVDPAVVLISNLAVGQGETLVCKLGQFIAICHLHQIKVAAVHTRFLTGERSTQHTISKKTTGRGFRGRLTHENRQNRLHLLDSLVFLTDSGTGGTDLTGWTLEFNVGALADATFTVTSAVAELPVLGHAR